MGPSPQVKLNHIISQEDILSVLRYSVNPCVGTFPSDVMKATRGLESPKGASGRLPMTDKAHNRASCIVSRIRR